MIYISILAPTKKLSILVEEESLPIFKSLVNRACNTWPDAPPEIKTFADQVTNGVVYQNYYDQDSSLRQRPDDLSDPT